MRGIQGNTVSRRHLRQLATVGVPAMATPFWISAQGKSQAGQNTVLCSELMAGGEISRAWYERAKDKIEMRLTKGPSEEGARSQLLFTLNGVAYLTVDSRIVRKGEEIALGRAAVSVKGKGIQYIIELDASNIRLKSGFPPVGVGKVQVVYNSKTWTGGFDFEAWHPVGAQGMPHLDSVLPEEMKAQTQPFEMVLEHTASQAVIKSGGIFKSPADAGTDGRPPQPSWGGRICRAACWGVGAGLGTTCCAGTAGLGCVLCVGGLAAGASACSESCPP